ncbi:acyl-CoA dehydrogenase N-terminal domain-containing protein, partial [Pseudomonas fluorescens]
MSDYKAPLRDMRFV